MRESHNERCRNEEGSERNRLPPTTEQPIGEYPTTYPREDANRGEQRDEQSAES